MAKVTIGNTDYDVPELNFVALELAWPHVEASTRELDPIKAVSAAIGVIAAGICQADNFNKADFQISPDQLMTDLEIHEAVTYFLKKKMRSSQIDNINKGMEQILEEAGLESTKGEGQEPPVAEAVTLSPETAPATSLN